MARLLRHAFGGLLVVRACCDSDHCAQDVSLLQHKLSVEEASAADDPNHWLAEVLQNASDILTHFSDINMSTTMENVRTGKPEKPNVTQVIKAFASTAKKGIPSGFETLSNDLTLTIAAVTSAKDLVDSFKDAFNRVLVADKEAAAAEAKKLKALSEMKPSLNTTIDLHESVQDSVPAQVHQLLPQASGLVDDTAAAAKSAARVAALAKVVAEAEKEFAEAILRRNQALSDQTQIAGKMEVLLEESIVTALNDTRIVDALNDSDRFRLPLNISKTTAAPPVEPVTHSSPYPSEFVIIALLILLAIAIAALAALQRPAA